MIISISIPILHGLIQSELPVQISVEKEINAVYGLINGDYVPFVRNPNGKFKTDVVCNADTEYLSCIESQINRMFN